MSRRVQVLKKATLGGHKDCIYALEEDIEPQYFYTSGGDGLISKWNLSNPEIGQLIVKIPSSVYAMRLIKEKNQLLVGQNFSGIHLIDLDHKREINSLLLSKAAIFDIQIFDKEIWVGLGDGVLVIIDLHQFKIKKHIKASEKSIRTIAFSTINNDVAVGYSDHTIRIFDRLNYTLKKEIKAHQNSVFALKYNKHHLLSGSRDAHLKAWETDHYTEEASIIAHMYAINDIVFDPTGNYFATSSMDKSIKIWDAKKLELLKVIDQGRLAGHGHSVNALLWTSYQNYLISGGDDRLIGVWDIKFN